ncbi:MAG: RepB family DNA primase [Acidobacteria bacterium]|nr:RepB family DNA primase [Acidobacteriota bacterium]MCI0718756.1 RepB family DNA primase [Acidobacteriota bacterium]
MNTVTSWDYIKQNYDPDDRLAVVIKNQMTGQVIQRLESAREIASPDFQRWLRFQNVKGCIYLSVNALLPEATGRTRTQIQTIRHVYLDIDQDGPAVLAKIISDRRIPQPNYVLNTSPGKFQTIWKVEEFTVEQAERLQRVMAAEFGADQAVIDAARVLRIPGLRNRKYDPPNQVTAEKLSDQTYKPSHFRLQLDLLPQPANATAPRPTTSHRPSNGRLSQSEIDWARVMRDLSRGHDPGAVQARLEQQRQDKHNPADYAARTVNKALAELARRRSLGAQCTVDGGLCHD